MRCDDGASHVITKGLMRLPYGMVSPPWRQISDD